MLSPSPLFYVETPVVQLHSPFLKYAGVDIIVKREDKNHTLVSGNKWWKLRDNLIAARQLGKRKLLTFGGAFSNHIYAVAAAAGELGLESVGIIRGERVYPLNPILRFAEEQGMKLRFVSREAYREKNHPAFQESLMNEEGDCYVIPEGGTNELAVSGCMDLGKMLAQITCDVICLPVGTGGTIAGIIAGCDGTRNVLGFSVLKGEFLTSSVTELLPNDPGHWAINDDYHFGGYAKTNPVLEKFIAEFEKDYNVPIEHVYTGKMFYGIFDMIEKGKFKKGSVILALHTGGVASKKVVADL